MIRTTSYNSPAYIYFMKLIGIHLVNPRYSSLYTKLAMFSLTQFQQILYFDLDFYFQKNPHPLALESCGREMIVCACRDYAMNRIFLKQSSLDNQIRVSDYFNAGFMVVKPSLALYNDLLRKLESDTPILKNYVFAEQDFLNVYFKDKWKLLPPTLNVMHVRNNIRENMVAIHEKFWILQRQFQGPEYLWNNERQIPKITSNVTMSAKERLRQKVYILAGDGSTLDSGSSTSPRRKDRRHESSWQHTNLLTLKSSEKEIKETKYVV